MAKDRSQASFGDVLEEIALRHVKIIRRYGCIRRDHYELKTDAAIPDGFRDYLATLGALQQTKTLVILDVPGAYQLTLAPLAGRMMVVPRLALDLPRQASVISEIAKKLDEILDATEALCYAQDR